MEDVLADGHVLLVDGELVVRGVLTSEHAVLIESGLAIERELAIEDVRGSERALLVKSSWTWTWAAGGEAPLTVIEEDRVIVRPAWCAGSSARCRRRPEVSASRAGSIGRAFPLLFTPEEERREGERGGEDSGCSLSLPLFVLSSDTFRVWFVLSSVTFRVWFVLSSVSLPTVPIAIAVEQNIVAFELC